MWRVEDKYLCNEQQLFLLQSRIGSILKADNNQYDDLGYRVTSVYFDDLYDSAYTDTLNGNAVRRKYRIRIYNGSLNRIQLEVKDKRYNRVLKKTQMITLEQMKCLLHGRQTDGRQYDMESPEGLFNLAIAQRGLSPKIIVEYDRKAFVCEQGNVRITFDRNIRVSDQITCFGRKSVTYDYLESPGDILEVKYDEFLPRYIAQTLETGNMFQTSYSKYMLGRERSQRNVYKRCH